VRDRETGITERVSVDSTEAEADENTWLPSISPDGRYVAFVSGASNLVPGDTNNSTDIFIRDRLLGSTQRVSVDSADNQGNANSNSPYISADGRYLAFASGASNLVPSDTNDRYDIFVRQQPLPVGGMAQLVDIETGAATGRSGLPAATVAAAVGAALLLASAIWYAGQQQRSLRRSRRAVRNSEPSSAPPEGK
jgi:hypothetical protein